MTTAERQRNRRARKRQAGVLTIEIEANRVAQEFLAECFEQCGEVQETKGATYLQWLLRGAAFSANAGAYGPKRAVPATALQGHGMATTRQGVEQ